MSISDIVFPPQADQPPSQELLMKHLDDRLSLYQPPPSYTGRNFGVVMQTMLDAIPDDASRSKFAVAMLLHVFLRMAPELPHVDYFVHGSDAMGLWVQEPSFGPVYGSPEFEGSWREKVLDIWCDLDSGGGKP
jgi:hypothetical protein